MTVKAVRAFKGAISSANWAWLRPFLLVAVILLVFSNSFGREFIWDDISLIAQNRWVQQPGQLGQLLTRDFWGFARSEGRGHDLYRPIVSLSYLIDARLWGARVPLYHLTNLLFHVLCSLTVYAVVKALRVGEWAAWLGALFFAVHPIHTESVTWISGRTDVICAFFFLLSLYLYLSHRRSQRGWHLIASLLAFALSLLSKEMASTLPLVIFLLGVCLPESREVPERMIARLGRAAIEALPYLVILALYLTTRSQVLGSALWTEAQVDGSLDDSATLRKVGARLLLSTKVIATYLRLLVVPYPLNALRLASDLESVTGFANWASPVVVVAVLALGILAIKRTPALAFALLFFLATILPVSWLFAVGDMVAERFLYIPSLSVCLALAVLYAWLREHSKLWAIVLVVAISLPWAVLTYVRNADWQDNLTFWSAAAAASPRSSIGHNFLGLEVWYRGRDAEAIAEFERARQIDPQDKDAFINLGAVYASQERYEEAETALLEARDLAPEAAIVHFNLGVVYERTGDWESAIAAYQETLSLDPEFLSAYYNLGLLHQGMGQWPEAVFYLERLLDIQPASTEAHNALGTIYLQLQLFPQALFEFEKMLELDPRSVQALSNLGMTYLNAGVLEQAIPPLQQATQIAPQFVPAHLNLGLAYLESGDRAKALKEWATVLELDSTNEEARRLIAELGEP